MWADVGYVALETGAIDDARELIERALGLYEQLEQPADRATTVAGYGLVALESDDEEQASYRFHEALERFRSLGIRPFVPEVLLGLAVIAARHGDSADAGRLVGAATAMRRIEKLPLESRLEAAAHAAATGRCSQQTWQHAVAAGLALDPQACIDLGLRAAKARPAAAVTT